MTRIKVIFSLLIVILTLGFVSSCTKGFISEDISPTIPISDTLSITYQTHISPIISNSCIGCHGGTNPEANLLLETYNQVRNSAENGTLIQRINDAVNPMPSSGLLPVQTRLLFDEWAQNGYLEN